MEKISDIAKWFINETNPDPLKLQKLLYFSQGISYCMNEHELFCDELEAWVHGPVNRDVYFEYKSFGHNPIDITYEVPQFNEETYKVLKFVKDNYSKYDSKYLEDFTHSQEPWIYARVGLDPDERNDKIIPKTIISDYFTSMMFQPDESEWSV